MTTVKRRVAVLISGRGSNMATLLAAAADGGYPVEMVGVIADRPNAGGIAKAEERGVATQIVAREDFSDKAAYETALGEALAAMNAEIVCLAGYMRLLSAEFVRGWEGRMINIHPSLLPLFKGLEPHRRALETGVRIHGCTVHFVTPQMDDGPIIAQAAVPVLPGDDEAALAARVLRAEHQLYPVALRMVAESKAVMENGKTVYSGFTANADVTSSLVFPGRTGDVVDIESLARMTP